MEIVGLPDCRWKLLNLVVRRFRHTRRIPTLARSRSVNKFPRHTSPRVHWIPANFELHIIRGYLMDFLFLGNVTIEPLVAISAKSGIR